MNRYSDSPGVRDVLFRLGLDPFGAGVVLIAPREHEAVAAALAETIPGLQRVSAAQVGQMGPVAHPVLVAGLGSPGPERDDSLSRINGRREWFSVHKQCVLLLVDPEEMMDLQRRAGDLWAAPNFRAEIAYIPDPDIDEAAARARLAEHLFHEHGRLDLRGLVRSDSEDVSLPIEDVFVELSAVAWPTMFSETTGGVAVAPQDAPAGTTGEDAAGHMADAVDARSPGPADALAPMPILSWVQVVVENPVRPLVVLGGPGAGKTFLLRWLALRAIRETALFGVPAAVPVLVPLAVFARAPLRPTLLEHVVFSLLSRAQPAGHLIQRLMEEGRVLFLFDGLDEVSNGVDKKRIRDGLHELRRVAPRCPMLLTSRVAGYDRDVELDPIDVSLVDLDDTSIRTFLTRWCELYAVDRKGDSDLSRAEGRNEGERLAADVLDSGSARQIAGNPLLLTVLAVVHRAGAHLPEHRVELYDHAARVLVERWNRSRSEENTDAPAPPLKLADAARLLGPLALRMVRSSVRSTVSLEVLREELASVLERGHLRGLATADEAIRLFHESLGVLVERAPGVFAFLHFTLAEFFAALELVRRAELEKVAADPKQAFAAELREVLLLGAGILGVLRAEDGRLGTLVGNLLARADQVTDPKSALPFLLLGLLAEDPGLTDPQKKALVETLIPSFWFARWARHEDAGDAALMAITALAQHLPRDTSERSPHAPWLGHLRARAAVCFSAHSSIPALRSPHVFLPEHFLNTLYLLEGFGTILDAPIDKLIVSCLRSLSDSELSLLASAEASELTLSSIATLSAVEVRPDGLFSVRIRSSFEEAARTGSLPLALRVAPGHSPGRLWFDVPVTDTRVERDGAPYRTVVFARPPDALPAGGDLIAGIVLHAGASIRRPERPASRRR